jgi:hypothetical protein
LTAYDYTRPYVDVASLSLFRATDQLMAERYGQVIRAGRLSNAEYAVRYERLAKPNNMRPPPSHGRIFDGWLVVRKLGTNGQYETWMPDHAFGDVYVHHEAK